ncbi:MAG: D-mannonate oxidoreductase [Rhizobium sp.]|nr:D-mannonate oxidoreductase [Rhizobium sp.]
MKTPILQFGTSRFLQAHADLFISEAADALGGITIVQTTASGERSKRLTALASPDGFPIHIRGKKDGAVIDAVTTVRSVKRAISANSDWAETARIFADEARLVICNTADKGYDISGEGDAFPEGVPVSFPGKLTKLLLHRFERGGEALTILPAELISRNGDVLKGVILELATRWRLPQAFPDWLESQVVFSNTLVDRIVSEPLEPAGAVAEPYALWAIERKPGQVLPCTHPSIVVADDISSFAQLKLFILNLGHTFLTDGWLKSGLPRDMTVRELLAVPEHRARLVDLYDNHILPGFTRMGMGNEARAYVDATIERFENPFLNHRLTDIADNHAEKIRRRAGGFLEWTGGRSSVLEELLASVP